MRPSLVTSIFLYASESSTLAAELRRRIRAMEMRCYRILLRISYKDYVINEEVRAKLTIRRLPDHRKETQTAVVWSCLPFIKSGQNHLARHSERGKKACQTEVEVGRQHQGMDRPGVNQVPKGIGEQGKMEETGCEIICGAPTTIAVKGWMMMMMMVMMTSKFYKADTTAIIFFFYGHFLQARDPPKPSFRAP